MGGAIFLDLINEVATGITQADSILGTNFSSKIVKYIVFTHWH